MRRQLLAGVAMAGLVALVGFRGYAVEEEGGRAGAASGRRCNDRTLQGTYGIQIQGTRPAGGQTESVVGVVSRTYDGQGSFAQTANVKGSLSGTIPNQRGVGVYQVNPNCTAIAILEPAPGVLIEERMVIVDGGRQVFSAPMQPAAAMLTGVQRRADD